jgi:hypothetical protein
MRCLRSAFFIAFSAFISGCVFVPGSGNGTWYSTAVFYVNDTFRGDSLSGRSILFLPVLTAKGPDTSSAFETGHIAVMFLDNRKDMQAVQWHDFENSYLAGHDRSSLLEFYTNMYKSDIVDVANSDSVWNAVDAPYAMAVRVKYVAIVKGMNGYEKRRLDMEIELWNSGLQETVWRAGVSGFSRNNNIDNDEFIAGAFADVFSRIPGYLPANNERNW